MADTNQHGIPLSRIDELAAGARDLPAKIHEQRRILQRRIDRLIDR